jgi:hypothetical protein
MQGGTSRPGDPPQSAAAYPDVPVKEGHPPALIRLLYRTEIVLSILT